MQTSDLYELFDTFSVGKTGILAMGGEILGHETLSLSKMVCGHSRDLDCERLEFRAPNEKGNG